MVHSTGSEFRPPFLSAGRNSAASLAAKPQQRKQQGLIPMSRIFKRLRRFALGPGGGNHLAKTRAALLRQFDLASDG
jgi:hypothetical protein